MSGISIATIKNPEFLNIQSVSPLISKCEIKVLYVGQNRNHSFITKEVATEMAATLPGTPIVGWFRENEDDFGDHGDQVVIDGDGIKFNTLTKPYGFVDINAKIWFQEFEDTDDFGNKVLREYLMTEGWLWTKQYEEAQKIINEGRPQSMELDEKTLTGKWSKDTNSGIEFFIINDAIFSKLCILGEDVEPCFEGSSITSPEVSATFSNNDFSKTLFSMMKELKALTYSLQKQGGESMAELENKTPETEIQAAQAAEPVETPAAESTENFSKDSDKIEQVAGDKNQDSTTEFEKKDDEEEKKEDNASDSNSEGEDAKDTEEDEKKKTQHSLEEKFALLEQEFNTLQEKYSVLEAENKELVSFKQKAEDKEKDALIETFYMLSDEDKKDVVENKAKYSLEEIKSKLAIICFDKKVDFNLNNETTSTEEEQVPLTYALSQEEEVLPAWLKAVEENRSK